VTLVCPLRRVRPGAVHHLHHLYGQLATTGGFGEYGESVWSLR